jgi:hypothetical protein
MALATSIGHLFRVIFAKFREKSTLCEKCISNLINFSGGFYEASHRKLRVKPSTSWRRREETGFLVQMHCPELRTR